MNANHYYQDPSSIAALATGKQSRKRLRFNPCVTVQPIDCRMTEEEKSKLYYSKNELNVSSHELKEKHNILSQEQLQHSSSNNSAQETALECNIGLEADPSLRGLERYLCPIRAQNKMLARKAMRKYREKINSNPNMTEEMKILSLAAVNAKLSQWSKLVALETARLDSIRAYDKDYMIPISDPVVISPFL
eukprot:CAMPEP_0201678494 /NCGR_PEP_ID=MMETSP0494-20130426/46380_1 /ASSEMBLY_ACC=CAM_ASM_000839 /TAXON_ID=420259 /ORGANISM="Thalassiosira gravida, Strain GMp14c1" /LENGTH=190 /DNA_ID=CAMNT_0048161687 /DNA_START=282 /DNA_END=851 /DNA_ORIENTATION=-